MSTANTLATIATLYQQNPTLFFSIIIGIVLVASLLVGIVIIRKIDLKDKDRLYYAVAEMNEVQRRADAREAEKLGAEAAREEVISEVELSDENAAIAEAEIDENTDENGESDTDSEHEEFAENQGDSVRPNDDNE